MFLFCKIYSCLSWCKKWSCGSVCMYGKEEWGRDWQLGWHLVSVVAEATVRAMFHTFLCYERYRNIFYCLIMRLQHSALDYGGSPQSVLLMWNVPSDLLYSQTLKSKTHRIKQVLRFAVMLRGPGLQLSLHVACFGGFLLLPALKQVIHIFECMMVRWLYWIIRNMASFLL